MTKEIGREEALQRRADHRFSEGSGLWGSDQGAVPSAWLLGGNRKPGQRIISPNISAICSLTRFFLDPVFLTRMIVSTRIVTDGPGYFEP